MMCTEQTGGHTNHPRGVGGQPSLWAAMELLGSGGRQGSNLQDTALTSERLSKLTAGTTSLWTTSKILHAWAF